MIEEYPKWIDEYARSIHHAFINAMPGAWGPLDAFTLWSYLDGGFIRKVSQAARILEDKSATKEQLESAFSNPSALRCVIFNLVMHYLGAEHKDKDVMRGAIDFMTKILEGWAEEDAFCYSKNIVKSRVEIEDLEGTIPWKGAEKEDARELGRLYNSMASWAYAVYRDFFPQDTLEVYGPYSPWPEKPGRILVMKELGKIQLQELWPDMDFPGIKKIETFQVYDGVSMDCEIVGMHTNYRGDLISGLVQYAVKIDGEFVEIDRIKECRNELAEMAVASSIVYKSMDKEDLKIKFLEWEGYQMKGFFELAGLDWRPGPELLEAIKDKEVPDKMIMETFPSYEEFVSSPDYEIYWLKDLYK